MKPVITISKSGPSGNIFFVVGCAIKTLRENNKGAVAASLQTDAAIEMGKEGTTYEDLIAMVEKYVIIEWY